VREDLVSSLGWSLLMGAPWTESLLVLACVHAFAESVRWLLESGEEAEEELVLSLACARCVRCAPR